MEGLQVIVFSGASSLQPPPQHLPIPTTNYHFVLYSTSPKGKQVVVDGGVEIC
jgi:hypothetical protein